MFGLYFRDMVWLITINRFLTRSPVFFSPSLRLSALGSSAFLAPRASLYSDTFQGFDLTRSRVAKANLLVSDQSEVKAKMKAEYLENGLKNIFNEEIQRLLLLSSSAEDLELCLSVICGQLQDNLHSLDYTNLSYNLQLFFEMCHIINTPEPAMKCWNEPEMRLILKSLKSRKRVERMFFDLLFKNEMYRELVDEFQVQPDQYSNLPGQAPLVLALLSLYKIGTRASLEEGLKLVPLVEQSKLSRSRSIKAMCLLAYNLGEHSVAHSLLTKQMKMRFEEKRKFSSFNDSLHVQILIATGKLSEAVTKFRIHFLPTSPRDKLTVYYCVVKDLLMAVKEKDDEELYKEVMKMVLFIEKSEQVYLSNQSLEEDLFRIVEPKNKN